MFLRDVGTLSPAEHILYNYWILMLELLKLGLPWDVIQEFTPEEMALVLAVKIASADKEAEDEARHDRINQRR